MTEVNRLVEVPDQRNLSTPKDHAIPHQECLWDAFRSGCESSFIRIYEIYVSDLFDYGCKFSDDEELVKDAIQDLFVEIRTNRQKLGKTGSIKFYLFKALRRKVVREKNTLLHKVIPLDQITHFELTFSHEQILINQQIQEEQVKQLNTALKKMTTRQREMVYYYFFEDLSYEQIKEIMGFSSLKATRTLLYRTIDSLKSTLIKK